jgi:lipoprotein-anchoring transpeptidase ErfK/SrfK
MNEINISRRQSRQTLANKLKTKKSHKTFWLLSLLVLIVVVVLFSFLYNTSGKETTDKTAPAVANNMQKGAASKPITAKSVCSDNKISQNIIVSIAQRHLWVCTTNKQLYNTAVITGNMNITADVTPVGVYQIYAKQTDQYLTGTDGVTSWNDYVYYWMPFLDNQYGVYGLHDATWRAKTDFGNISPYSSQASHGCVELPLTAAAWIYNWATIGTTVTIKA